MIEVVKGSVVDQKVDAIVNAANAGLRGGGGVDGAIQRAAGPELLRACRRLYPDGCPTGEARITDAYGITNARHIIHAVGPVYASRDAERCERQLRGAYSYSCELALEAGDSSIAFPCISCGVYGYPFDDATRIAVDELQRYVGRFERIVLAMFKPQEIIRAKEILADAPNVRFVG
jgi:O-acetyl-ADP-ribose deacetylase (regulator of RNase III)